MLGSWLVSQGVVRPTLTGHKLNSDVPFQNALSVLSNSFHIVPRRPATTAGAALSSIT